MPDARAPGPTPRDWSDALAALPLETAPSDGWRRLSAALPPPAPARKAGARGRRPAFAALAAAVALAAVLPMVPWRPAPAPSTPAPTAGVDGTPSHASPVPGTPAGPAIDPSRAVATTGPAADPATAAQRPVSPSMRASHRPAKRAGDPTPAALAALYTESAQLEAVLARLPESGARNAAAVALATELQDQVAHIDAALSQPTLAEDDRAALWAQRVDTLRQLTGVEAAQRWQVALGDTAHAADTAIY